MKYKWHRDPELKKAYATERKKQADAWRLVRKKNPTIARLIWRRVKAAEAEISKHFFG